jgi:hypothetical protein
VGVERVAVERDDTAAVREDVVDGEVETVRVALELPTVERVRVGRRGPAENSAPPRAPSHSNPLPHRARTAATSRRSVCRGSSLASPSFGVGATEGSSST